MKNLIALHGNPGALEDWNVLSEKLPASSYQLKAFDSYSDSWVAEVQKGLAKKILLAHSWGAYPILKNLKPLAPFVEKVILVAPYARPENPLPAIAGVLMKTPLLGEKLLKSSHQKMQNVFVPEMIHPQKMSDHPYYQTLETRFADWRRWQKAAFAKLEMQKHPWQQSWVTDVPLTLIFGSEDKTSIPENQNIIFKNYPNTRTKIIAHAGHGLLWSHPDEIIAAINEEIP